MPFFAMPGVTAPAFQAAGRLISFAPSAFCTSARRPLLFSLYVSLLLHCILVSSPSLESAQAVVQHEDDAETSGADLFTGIQVPSEQAGSAEFTRRMQDMMVEAGNITDEFSVKIAALTEQIDAVRMEVNKAKGELLRLNELFDDKTEKTLRMINGRIAEFSSGLERIETELSEQLKPGTGVVSKRFEELRVQLLESRTQAENHFQSEAYGLLRQVDTCSSRVDALTRIYFDMRHRIDAEMTDIDVRMIDTRRELEDLVQQRMAALAATEQRVTTQAVDRLVEFLKNLRLEENMLQEIVRSIQRQFLEPSGSVGTRAHREKGATYIDLSSSFANSKIEKVCVVMTHQVQQLLPGKTVIPIFIHTVPAVSTLSRPKRRHGSRPFGGLGGARAILASLKLAPPGWALSEAPKLSELQSRIDAPTGIVVPDEHIIAAAAAQWLPERQAFGSRSDHYAMVRIDGLLVESYTVPALQYQPFDYARAKSLTLVRPEQFAERLEAAMRAKLDVLEDALAKDTFLLIAYLGEATENVVKPRASLRRTANLIAVARSVERNMESPSAAVSPPIEHFRLQLRFIDEMAKIYAGCEKKNLAARSVLQGDEIEIVVVVGGKGGGGGKVAVETPPCREHDPFFRQAFAVLSMNLTAVTRNIFAFPSDMLLAKTLSGLIRGLEDDAAGHREEGGEGGYKGVKPVCGAVISTGGVAKWAWRQQVLKASLSFMQQSTEAGTDESGKEEATSALKEVSVVKESTRDAVEASLQKGHMGLPKYVMGAIMRVMRDRLGFVSRGYTLYVTVNVGV